MKKLFLLAGIWLSVAPSQAGLFNISPAKEREMGQDAAREIDIGARIVTGPVADWVAGIGARLAAVSDKEFEYSFKVVDAKEINAFALPAGHIYVFTGLRKVARTEDELAAVLAHEVTHSEQHHYAKQFGRESKRGALLSVLSIVAGLPNLAQQALGMLDFAMSQKYSRTHETESDLAGMERMNKAGFDPAAMVTILERLAKEDEGGGTLDQWFGDHPDSGRRIERAKVKLGELRPNGVPVNAPKP